MQQWQKLIQEKRKAVKEQQAKIENVFCKKFGCNKKLSHTENLYGEYCFSHSQKNRIEIVNKMLAVNKNEPL